MDEKEIIIFQDEMEERNLLPGAKVRFVHSSNMTLASWHFEEGTPLPEHFHKHEQITRIISGKLDLKINGTVHHLVKGFTAIIPPNAVHSALAVSECDVVDVFYPVRDDYK